jgi:nickel-dependent lactate racemase
VQTVKFPFGEKFLELRLEQPAEVLLPELVPAVPDALAAIRQAMAQPIGSEPLATLARGKRTAVIVVNDITRPAPSESMLTVIMEELTAAGLDPANVAVIIAVGNHEMPTEQEIQEITGRWRNRLKIVSHDCYDESLLTYAGETARHLPVYINSYFAKADLRITTGLITPHQSAGFSGGRKSIIPGITGIKTISTHHSFPIRPEGPVMGIRGNTFHQEAVAAARLVGVDFIVNVIKNYRGQVVEVVAGDLEAAHDRGVDICEKGWVRKFDSGYDVIFVSPGGYPKDIDLHQAQKAISVAEQVVNPGGAIVLIAECRKGIGKFGATLKKADSVDTVIRNFYKEGFSGEGHSSKAYMYARACKKCRLLVVSSIDPAELSDMFMTGFRSLPEAAEAALSNYSTPTAAKPASVGDPGRQPKVLCIPYTGECIPVLAGNLVTA